MSEKKLDFLDALGLPSFHFHQTKPSFFDVEKQSQIVFVIGPMGAGKTQFANELWQRLKLLRGKSDRVQKELSFQGSNRSRTFFIRPELDRQRFMHYPENSLAYRSGYSLLEKDEIAFARTALDIQEVFSTHTDRGFWIVDEPAFYDERLVYILEEEVHQKRSIILLTGLYLNFRREIFNKTAKFLFDISTDVIALSAYCQHPDCIARTAYTYRWYSFEGKELPALYFDPLILVGGDVSKESFVEPNYEARCLEHHYLPGKEYVYRYLLPLVKEALELPSTGFITELERLRSGNYQKSLLYRSLLSETQMYVPEKRELFLASLKTPYLIERLLLYLSVEEKLLPRDSAESLIEKLDLDKTYWKKAFRDEQKISS